MIGTSPPSLQSTNFSANINVYFFMALKHGMLRNRVQKIQLQTSINKLMLLKHTRDKVARDDPHLTTGGKLRDKIQSNQMYRKGGGERTAIHVECL